jgi:hypothetical protein
MKESTFSKVMEESMTQGRERRESYAAECESELRDMIVNEIQKKVSRIFSVQFHNVEPEEIFGKIVNFKIDQSLIGEKQEEKGLYLSNLVHLIENSRESDVIKYDGFKIIVKERLTQHNLIIDI